MPKHAWPSILHGNIHPSAFKGFDRSGIDYFDLNTLLGLWAVENPERAARCRDLLSQAVYVGDLFRFQTEAEASFHIVATCGPGTDPETLEAAIDDHLAAVAAGSLRAEELVRAQNRILTASFSALQTLDRRADLMSALPHLELTVRSSDWTGLSSWTPVLAACARKPNLYVESPFLEVYRNVHT